MFTKRRWGGGGRGQRQLLSLCTPNHTNRHTHTDTHTIALTRRAVAVLETPQALQCVCVFVLQLAAGTSGSDWQAYTHQPPPPTTAEHGAGWMCDKACGFWLTRSAEESNASRVNRLDESEVLCVTRVASLTLVERRRPWAPPKKSKPFWTKHSNLRV